MNNYMMGIGYSVIVTQHKRGMLLIKFMVLQWNGLLLSNVMTNKCFHFDEMTHNVLQFMLMRYPVPQDVARESRDVLFE